MPEAVIDPRSSPQAAPETRTLIQEARVPNSAKACAVAGGVIGSVCCGTGVVALIATIIGSASLANWTLWGGMQGLTLMSTGVVLLLVLGLAALVTRQARAGLAGSDGRRVYMRALSRLAAWGLVGYAAYFIIVNMILQIAGFHYKG